MATVEVLVGMIASGKSTWAKDRAMEGWIIVNDDSIVNAVHANVHTLYDKSLKPLYKSVEDHMLHTAIAMDKKVVIDRGVDVSIKSRKRWLAICNSLDVPVVAIVFESFPAEVHAKRRTDSDSRGHDLDYWLNAAEAHQNRYELPTIEEGFTAIVHKKWDSP